MQIHTIIKSLNTIATEEDGSMAAALATAGFVGKLHHGNRAAASGAPGDGGGDKPFALINCEEVDSEANSSGVKLVTYLVTLTVVADQKIETVGPILELYHRYWDRLVGLPDLDPDLAKFVLIHPTPTPSEIGEAEREDLGQDVLLGVTSWLLKLSEHQPELE